MPLVQSSQQSPPLAAAISPTRGETDGGPPLPLQRNPEKIIQPHRGQHDGITEAAVSTAASLQFRFASM